MGPDLASQISVSAGVIREGEDIPIWKAERSGSFSIKSAWGLVRYHGQTVSWYKTVWHN